MRPRLFFLHARAACLPRRTRRRWHPHRDADLQGASLHFFRRAFKLLKPNGVFGLIATNTIGQGDTRDTGLAAIIREGGGIARATRRLKWPGEAAVVVSVVHVVKGAICSPILDGRQVGRISAYLVEGNIDRTPARISSSLRRSFQGTNPVGAGFLFDDERAKKSETSSLSKMNEIIATDRGAREFIKEYTSGEDLANSPTLSHSRYLIDFGEMSESETRSACPSSRSPSFRQASTRKAPEPQAGSQTLMSRT